MTKGRRNFNLLVVRGELYAMGDERYRSSMTSIERLDKVSGEWRVAKEIEEDRSYRSEIQQWTPRSTCWVVGLGKNLPPGMRLMLIVNSGHLPVRRYWSSVASCPESFSVEVQ